MSHTNAGGPPLEALQACADDLEVAPGDLEAGPPPFARTHYKSRIFFVRPRAQATPSHVIKLDEANAYDPEREQEALQIAARWLAEAGERARSLRVVCPIAWSADPKYLITRHQPGELSQSSIDAAVFARTRDDPMTEARRQVRMIGQWLAVFRERGARDEGGPRPEDLHEQIAVQAAEVGGRLGRENALRAVAICAERYVQQLDDRARSELRASQPSRGDARPKNFLAGPDGALYAFDMEGFGYGAVHQDLACMHHSLEYDGVRTPAARTRATLLWNEFLAECLQPERSSALALLGYLRFLLGRLELASDRAAAGWGRWARDRIWTRNRLRWLSGLTGDLETDVAYFHQHL